MRQDFHIDKRLQQAADGSAPAPGAGSFGDQNAQWANEYAKATTDGEKARVAADWYNFRLRAGLLDKGASAKQALVDSFTALQTARATKSQDLTVRAGEAEFQARQGIITKHADLESTAAGQRFSLKLSPVQIQMQMLSGIKAMATTIESIVGMFGNNNFKIDTSKIDAKIEELTAQIDNVQMDTSGVDRTDASISSASAIRSLDTTTALAGQDLQGASRTDLDNFVKAMGGSVGSPSASAAAPEVAGPSKVSVITSVSKMVEDKWITRDQGKQIVDAYAAAASNSGNKDAVDTRADVNLIDKMLEKALNNPELKAKVEAQLNLAPEAPKVAASGPTPNAAVDG